MSDQTDTVSVGDETQPPDETPPPYDAAELPVRIMCQCSPGCPEIMATYREERLLIRARRHGQEHFAVIAPPR